MALSIAAQTIEANKRPTTRLLRRVFKRIDVIDGCWVWRGYINKFGYGWFSIKTRLVCLHRLTYRWFVGELEAGLQLDHLCRNRACCNPAHLELVTAAENLHRGQLARGFVCPQGHDLSEVRLRYSASPSRLRPTFYRPCQQCINARQRLRYHRRRAALK